LEKGLALRAKLPAELFVDCSQQALVEDPLGVVQRVYDAFGLTLSEPSREVLSAHVRANPKGKHGRHEYQLDDYGLTREMIAQRFAFYTDDSRWPISA
jgi:hypothetical protein